ncbi:MAG: c-type cytochrome [Candidatus Solibacter sp.]
MRFVALFALASVGWTQIPTGRLFNAQADPEAGRKLWSANCAVCHGEQGKGARGPDLTTGKFRHGGTDEDLFRAMTKGIPGSEMPGFPLSALESMQLVAHMRVLGRSALPAPVGGDAARGRTLFAGSGQCTTCHRVQDTGAHIGPDLSDVGARLAPVALLAALLRPDETVRPEHYFVRVVTLDGRTVTGRRMNEDTYSVQLIDAQDRLTGIVKDEIKEYELIRKSAMPAYEGKLTPEQLSDLVAYLASLKGAR